VESSRKSPIKMNRQANIMGSSNFFCLHFEFAKKYKIKIVSFSFFKGFNIVHKCVTHRGLDVMSLFNIVHILDVRFENMLRYGNVNTRY
jgi:hypothetical protein